MLSQKFRSYLPRILTCLVASALLSLTVFIPSGYDDSYQRLYIVTKGSTDDIERTIKSMERSDIRILHDSGGVSLTPFEGWIAFSVLGTFLLAFVWAVMSFIHMAFVKILND